MKRQFQGLWIPAALWFAKELTVMEKLFFVEIQSLDNPPTGCYAKNKHFVEIFQLSPTRCSNVIKSLEKKGWITIELQYTKKVISKRICRVVDNLPGGVCHKQHTPYAINNIGYVENFEERYTNPKNTKNQKTKSPTASAVGLFKPSAPLFQLARIYVRSGEQKRFVTALINDVSDVIKLEVVTGALESLSHRDDFEPLTAHDAIGYCKAALYKGSKNDKTAPKAGE